MGKVGAQHPPPASTDRTILRLADPTPFVRPPRGPPPSGRGLNGIVRGLVPGPQVCRGKVLRIFAFCPWKCAGKLRYLKERFSYCMGRATQTGMEQSEVPTVSCQCLDQVNVGYECYLICEGGRQASTKSADGQLIPTPKKSAGASRAYS